MRIFIAGATGTLGRPVARLLLSRGHEVVGLTRSAERARTLEKGGVRAVVGDALDAAGLRSLVVAARPEVVVHLLTALPPAGVARPRQLRSTNVLRVDGTAHLLQASIEARARRLVAESFVAVYGLPKAGSPMAEDDPLPAVDRGGFSETVAALRSLEDQLLTARRTGRIETVALRIGFLYGPDVPSTDALVEQARRRRLFAPSEMTGLSPFVHIADAVTAIVAAIERPVPSFAYNIVDDEPLAATTFLARLTQALGAPPPRRLPAWVIRLAAPVMAELGSASLRLSNAKARQELGWSPRYPRMDDGLANLGRRVGEAA